jgi:diguanylate cyclase (GGDEF)-like protein
MLVCTGFPFRWKVGFSQQQMQEISVLDQGQIAEVDILRAFLSASEAALMLVSSDGTVRYASEGAQNLYGNGVVPLVGQQVFGLVKPLVAEQLKAHFTDMATNGTTRVEVLFSLSDFATHPTIETNNCSIQLEIVNFHDNASLNGFVMIVRELGEAILSPQEQLLRTKIEGLLSKTLARFANASIGSTERDLHESLGEFCELAGIERAMLWVLDESGRMFVPENEVHSVEVLPLEGRAPNLPLMVVKNQAPGLWDGAWIVATRENNFSPLLKAIEIPEFGAIAQITFAPLRCEGQLVGLLSLNATDVSTLWSEHTKSYIDSVTNIFGNALNRREAERSLAFQALHDSLTGLPNRSLLLDRLRIALARSARTTDNVCVMLIDLDGFKQVNDTLGHGAGDELLQVISRRLVDTMRDADSVARLGGDEFVIVAETATDEVNARIVADRVLDVLRQPVRVGDTELLVSGSVGLVVANASHDRTLDPGALLRKADIAMYRAKTGGRNRMEIYRDEMDRRVLFSS